MTQDTRAGTGAEYTIPDRWWLYDNGAQGYQPVSQDFCVTLWKRDPHGPMVQATGETYSQAFAEACRKALELDKRHPRS